MLNLYETYYKLSADPFRLSPDHHFAYAHKGYASAKAYLEYAFFQGEGFVMVTGDPGTGKTTLINEILSGLDQSQLQVATLATTQLDTRDLLHMIAVLLGMQVGEVSKPALLMDLEKYLAEQADRGRSSILVVDEAQGLSPSGLEELRLLANLQHRNRLLLQICLIGQDQLRNLVQTPEMKHLHQRIIAASHLKALTLEESVDYIEYRLCHVGWNGDPSISEGALRQIYRHSGGIPRLINLICNRLFLYGGLESKHEFETADARQVIGELQQEQLLQTESLMEDDAEQDNYDETSAREPSDLSLPRFDSVSATVQSVKEALQREPALTEINGDLTPPEETNTDNQATEPDQVMTDDTQEVRVELGESNVSTTRPDALDREEKEFEETPPESEALETSHSYRVMGVMALLLGLVLVAAISSESGNPIVGRLKAEWLRLMTPESEVRTSVESGRHLSTESAGDNGSRVSVAVEKPGAALPRSVVPAEIDNKPIPTALPATTLTDEKLSPAAGLQEAEAVQLQEIPQQPAAVPSPVVAPVVDDWQAAIAEGKRRLEQEARQVFERRITEKKSVETVPDKQSVNQVANTVSLSSMGSKSSVVEHKNIFSSLKDIHVALLEGRWTVHGKPAVFLPSEITFCAQGAAHDRITCWSIPQYVKTGQRTNLQKVETTLQDFSSEGNFELIYRSMNAPAAGDNAPLFWQTTEHQLRCEFSAPDKVICSNKSSGEAIDLMRSPLSSSNNVGIDSQEHT